MNTTTFIYASSIVKETPKSILCDTQYSWGDRAGQIWIPKKVIISKETADITKIEVPVRWMNMCGYIVE